MTTSDRIPLSRTVALEQWNDGDNRLFHRRAPYYYVVRAGEQSLDHSGEGQHSLEADRRATRQSSFRQGTISRDAPHARAEVECKNCHDSRTFYAHISPDPQRRGPARVEREAAGWLQSHPCYLTTAHPKRLHRGAAA